MVLVVITIYIHYAHDVYNIIGFKVLMYYNMRAGKDFRHAVNAGRL